MHIRIDQTNGYPASLGRCEAPSEPWARDTKKGRVASRATARAEPRPTNLASPYRPMVSNGLAATVRPAWDRPPKGVAAIPRVVGDSTSDHPDSSVLRTHIGRASRAHNVAGF